MIKFITGFLVLGGLTGAHETHAQSPIVAGPHRGFWYNTLPGDGGTQVRIKHRYSHQALTGYTNFE